MNRFQLEFEGHLIQGDAYDTVCSGIVLHGAGAASLERYVQLRQGLKAKGLATVGFDFIGHGKTGGDLTRTSLEARTQQAERVIRQTCQEPLTIIAASMSGYTAIKLTETFRVENLVLLVPAVYTAKAYRVRFGPRFSDIIRVPGSWRTSDAFELLSRFQGNLLVVAAENDRVIPGEVIQGLHASATRARTKEICIIPGAEHRSLFSIPGDREMVIDRIIGMCGRLSVPDLAMQA